MALGIVLTGKPTKPAPRRAVEHWFRERCADLLLRADCRDEQDALWLSLHPAAEDVEIRRHDGLLTINARTSTAGPGYHVYVCEVLGAFAEAFGIHWDEATDDTNYFTTGRVSDVDSAMKDWLCRTLEVCLKDTRFQGSRFQIAMPLGYSYTYTGFAGTYLGPRSREWVRSVLDGEREASEFFPWWESDRNAGYFARRALCHMWTAVRWRKPLTGDEAVTLEQVDGLLTDAYRSDPQHEMPWREWAEVRSYLGRIDELTGSILSRAMTVEESEPLVGYRRSDVRVLVADGWSIQVPGSFAESWDEEDRWSAWDDSRSVRLIAFSTTGAEVPATVSEVFGRSSEHTGETFTQQGDGILGQARATERFEQGRPIFRLDGVSVSDRRFAVTTITSRNAGDRGWALTTWRSVENTASPAP